MSGAKKQLLLIGAGPTSSLISYNIAKTPSLRSKVDIHVVEKSSEIGGRFRTAWSSKCGDCFLDLGAQYLTHNLSNPISKSYFDDLFQRNMLRPLEPMKGFKTDSSKSHFACTQGLASIVRHFFDRASIRQDDIEFDCKVIAIKPLSSGGVKVTTQNQSEKTFDLVIATMPVPEILNLDNCSELLSDLQLKRNLETVKYSSRFALGIYFDNDHQLLSACQAINFVEDDNIIRYWSIENWKRQGVLEGPTSVVVHTGIGYGAKNIDQNEDEVKIQLLKKTSMIIPEVASIPTESVECHKWTYSQVLDTFVGKPGFVRLNDNIYAAGDGFAESGFEGCIFSALKMVDDLSSCI